MAIIIAAFSKYTTVVEKTVVSNYMMLIKIEILKMLIRAYFRDVLQPAEYYFVPGMMWLSASFYSKFTVCTVNLCYLQVLAMYKKVLS